MIGIILSLCIGLIEPIKEYLQVRYKKYNTKEKKKFFPVLSIIGIVIGAVVVLASTIINTKISNCSLVLQNQRDSLLAENFDSLKENDKSLRDGQMESKYPLFPLHTNVKFSLDANCDRSLDLYVLRLNKLIDAVAKDKGFPKEFQLIEEGVGKKLYCSNFNIDSKTNNNNVKELLSLLNERFLPSIQIEFYRNQTKDFSPNRHFDLALTGKEFTSLIQGNKISFSYVPNWGILEYEYDLYNFNKYVKSNSIHSILSFKNGLMTISLGNNPFYRIESVYFKDGSVVPNEYNLVPENKYSRLNSCKDSILYFIFSGKQFPLERN